MALSVSEQLTQLDAARQLVLADSGLYPQIVQGILPIVGANARLELRRWGADFLAETFASPLLGSQEKERLSIVILKTLRELLENPGEDNNVVKSVIQAAASIYALVFQYIISNPQDSATWDRMSAIKSNVFRRWDTAPGGIRVCCIKFVQRVVQVQTPGEIADPRRPEQYEVSLALVPRDHPLVPRSRLEPEALGLLDRLINVFHEETSDPILVNATLNCLGTLIRTRPNAANKIINALLNFNPLKQANTPMTPKTRVQIKSMEKTTRMVLLNVLRRNENAPFAVRIRQYIDRLTQARFDVFDEGNRKRTLPSEPTDGLDSAKRMRLGAELPERSGPPPLPPGPVSHAQLFTLTGDRALTSFDVTQLPIDLIVRITIPMLHRVEQPAVDAAVNAVRSRFLAVKKNQAAQAQAPAQPLGEDEEDYEPDFEPTEEQTLNQVSNLPPEEPLQIPSDLALGPFKLPQPPPLTAAETEQIGKGTISRVFSMMSVLEESSAAKRQKPGLNRLAGSKYDRDAWMTVITRLATRASAGLDEDEEDTTDNEKDGSKGAIARQTPTPSLSDGIRETLWKYIIEDFRARIPIAISWLNEEWFNDRIQFLNHDRQDIGKRQPRQHYEKWMLKILDSILPFLDAKDKVLIRFLSEIPALDKRVLDRVKGLARDPERVTLAVNALYYLTLVRPPVRETCIDALEDLWRSLLVLSRTSANIPLLSDDDAKAPAAKLLKKLRPEVLKEASPKAEPPPPAEGIASRPPNGGKEDLPLASVKDEGIEAPPNAVAAAG
ncbi:MAG: hypothetical protein L6R40_005971 [Gallowayella cf. fulva]|nr:MAG: hypothetical protein L6R40_005971 [Xanthomendoza cf. fulva]